MKTTKILLLSTLLTISLGSIAHEDHGNKHFQEANITQQQAESIAIDEIAKQINNQKIHSTWDKATSSAVLSRLDGRQVWKIIFILSTENKDHKKLEILVSQKGHLISN
jgi:hypothetical protein